MSDPRPHPSILAAPSPRIALPLLAFLLLAVFRPTATHAQRVELSSPLDGNVRAGRAVAVRVVAEGLAGSTLTLAGPAAGVVPVRLPVSGGRVDAVVPVNFAGDPPAALDWSDGKASGTAPVSLRLLGVDDRLVAVAGDAMSAGGDAMSAGGDAMSAGGGVAPASLATSAGEPAGSAAALAKLFPGTRAVVVPIDTNRPRVLSPAAAFEAVDALLLDAPAAARMDEDQLRTLLAAGTTVAVRAADGGSASGGPASSSPAASPVPGWPWVRAGGWWVLRHEVAGPRGGVNPDVYAPTYAWDRSWPAGTRRGALLAAAVVAIAVLAASLWRGRRATVAAVIVCAAAAGGAAAYGLALAPVATAAGDVVATDGRLAQRDRWQYVSALRAAAASVPAADGLTKPALGTRRPVEGLTVTLDCAADGSPLRYELTLPAKTTVAFLSRTVGPETSTVPSGTPGTSGTPSTAPAAAAAANVPALLTVPVGLFADKLYPGTAAGQSEGRPPDAPPVGAWWGTVVMRR